MFLSNFHVIDLLQVCNQFCCFLSQHPPPPPPPPPPPSSNADQFYTTTSNTNKIPDTSFYSGYTQQHNTHQNLQSGGYGSAGTATGFVSYGQTNRQANVQPQNSTSAWAPTSSPFKAQLPFSPMASNNTAANQIVVDHAVKRVKKAKTAMVHYLDWFVTLFVIFLYFYACLFLQISANRFSHSSTLAPPPQPGIPTVNPSTKDQFPPSLVTYCDRVFAACSAANKPASQVCLGVTMTLVCFCFIFFNLLKNRKYFHLAYNCYRRISVILLRHVSATNCSGKLIGQKGHYHPL